MFSKLRDSLDKFETYSLVGGTVTTNSLENKPILIALYNLGSENKYKLESFTARYGTGDFELFVASGEYYLVAFEDLNEDFILQDNELVGWHGEPTKIDVKNGNDFLNLNIELRVPEQAIRELPGLYAPTTTRTPLSLPESRAGIVTSIDDPRFAHENGAMGMWEPTKFIEEKKHGLFFLEPFQEDKIPVILIHGLTGTGADWRYIIKHMDRTKFQPWIVQYPSGLRLDLVSRELSKEVTKLQLQLKFKKFIVVAHSMGGLVARGFINHNLELNKYCDIPLFVTLSTPWNGHSAAQLGVDKAPVVVPAWYDIVPNSPYLESLFATPLPTDTHHYLFFSHRATRLINKNSSDGSVTIKSQLPIHAQEAATQVLGFDEDHVSILYSKQLTQKLNQLLSTESLP